jgi:hypothetical protein
MGRGTESVIHEVRVTPFPPPPAKPTDPNAAPTPDVEDCDTCRYTGTALCTAASVYLLVQRHRQAQHKQFMLGMAGGCFALGVARWFA